ncbi:MAG: SLC13 family permease [Pseudomarimonas sp.]
MSPVAWFTVVVTLLVVMGLARERLPSHRVALGGLLALLLAGALTPQQALATIGSTGLVTVICMFLLAAALEYTGAIDDAVRRLLRIAGTRPRTAWATFFAAVLLGSAVIPNTPVVVLACPVAVLLAQRTRTAPSQVLIPLTYLATLGGSLTLIGSSINVVADALLREHGETGFQLFSLVPVALPVALVGVTFLLLCGRWLLPRGEVASARLFDPQRRFLQERRVSATDILLGKPLGESLLTDSGVEVLEVFPAANPQQKPANAQPALAGYRPHANDRILLRRSAADLAAEAQAASPLAANERLVLETWVPPSSRLTGVRVDALRLDYIFGVQLLGIAPLNSSVRDLATHAVGTGDRLLLAGSRGELERFLVTESALGPLQLERTRQARDKAPFALATLLGFVIAAASGWLALEVAALAAAAALVVFGAMPSRHFIPPVLLRTLGMLLGMLGIGAALEATGATAAMVTPLIGAAADLGPWTLLIVVFATAALLTEFITNNAVIVLILPLVLGVTQSLGLNAWPFALAVVFGASSSFATPIGYQTNTWVYQLGNYRFAHFVRIGLPLKLVVGVTAVAMIGLLYPPAA